MTSTLFQSPQATRTQSQTTTTTTTTATRKVVADSGMAWPNEKMRLPCIDSIGLRQLWKLIALDSLKSRAGGNNITNNKHNKNSNNTSNNNNNNNSRRILINDEQQEWQYKNNNNNNNNNNSINNSNIRINIDNTNAKIPNNNNNSSSEDNENKLEANTSPILALLTCQKQDDSMVLTKQPKGWMQLSGHPESFVPTASGIVRKRISSLDDHELRSYQLLSNETETAPMVPYFYGTVQLNGQLFIELQDLLAGFRDPCVMDIKMGCRTFLESEVNNKTLRPDLYKKMLAVDTNAPTAEENQAQAITKLRYMLFREAMSSSHTKGFRIEALRMRGRSPQKDLKTVQSNEQIEQTISQFVGSSKHDVFKQLLKRLRYMRTTIERSTFFARHEIVGSSVFIVYDDERVNAWLIDFAKSRELPAEVQVNHRSDWLPGNREEGLLKGLDELIASFERVRDRQNSVFVAGGGGSNGSGSVRKCLQI